MAMFQRRQCLPAWQWKSDIDNMAAAAVDGAGDDAARVAAAWLRRRSVAAPRPRARAPAADIDGPSGPGVSRSLHLAMGRRLRMRPSRLRIRIRLGRPTVTV